MEVKFEYNDKEVEQIVLDAHEEIYAVPDGMKYVAVSKSYGGVEVVAVKEEKGSPEAEA